jgi:hypothetical protein
MLYPISSFIIHKKPPVKIGECHRKNSKRLDLPQGHRKNHFDGLPNLDRRGEQATLNEIERMTL